MIEKTEFEKIGVNHISPFKSNGRLVFRHGNQNYDISPAGIMDSVLSPLVVGADRLMMLCCQMKGINPELGFNLLFSEKYFPNADIMFNFVKIKHDGWIYLVEELNLKGFISGQSAWICSYMKLYYSEPPKVLYLKIESERINCVS